MKTQRSKIAKLMLGLTTIAIAAAVLCFTQSARAEAGQSSASRRSPHGGGSGGGLPYPTASTVIQLIAAKPVEFRAPISASAGKSFAA